MTDALIWIAGACLGWAIAGWMHAAGHQLRWSRWGFLARVAVVEVLCGMGLRMAYGD